MEYLPDAKKIKNPGFWGLGVKGENSPYFPLFPRLGSALLRIEKFYNPKQGLFCYNSHSFQGLQCYPLLMWQWEDFSRAP